MSAVPKLPEPVLRRVRITSLPHHLRALFAHLPDRLQLAIELPHEAELSLAARQLLKLGLLVPTLEIADVEVGAVATRIVASRASRRCELDEAALASDLALIVERLLETLFDPRDVARLLDAFAVQSSTLTTLQKITRYMLSAPDLDRALYVLLSGVTSSYGLGFNRAVLFVHDPDRGVFVGSKAIGPTDERAAHLIWEAIEAHDLTIEHLVDDHAERGFDAPFEQLARSIELRAGTEDDDEVTLAQVDPPPLVFVRPRPRNTGLQRLGAHREFVLAALGPRGRTLGLLYADDVYGGGPIDAERLARVRFYLEQTALVWDNLSLLRRVEDLARYDGLTRVFNRRQFEARFDEERAGAARSAVPCAVILVDVDRFKQINDEHGHERGDDVLRRLAALVRGAVRERDVVARYGGDELIAFLANADKNDVRAIAMALGQAAQAEGISVSIGGACWPDDCDDTARLVALADAQLYAAKRAGRGRAAFVGASPQPFAAPDARAGGGVNDTN